MLWPRLSNPKNIALMPSCALISTPMSKRDYARWGEPVFTYASPAAFFATRRFVSGIHAICLAGGRTLDILLKDKFSTQAIIFFNAAHDPQKIKLPAFSGLAVSASLPATTICLSDPALDDAEGLSQCWYAGSWRCELQKILPDLLAHLLHAIGVQRSILFGASGGGFAAMVYARGLSNALPIAINPQTRISRYDIDKVGAFAKACYDWDGEKEIKTYLNGRLIERLSLLYRIGGTPFIYVQNKGDEHLVNEHAIPFMAELRGPRKVINTKLGSGYIFFEHWGAAGTRLPREHVADILTRAVFFKGPWVEFIDLLGTPRKGTTGFMNDLARSAQQDVLKNKKPTRKKA